MSRWSLLAIVALAPQVARAQKDVASCKPVLDAVAKEADTPHHVYGTTTSTYTGGKPRATEVISTGGQSYVLTAGHWTRSLLTPAFMAKQQQDDVRNATAYACHRIREESVAGVAAVVYGTHTEIDGAKSDGQVWVAPGTGLVLRTEVDVDAGAAGGKSHTSARYEYTNVHPPAGVE